MNYPAFLKKIDELASRCNADSLRLFVHEIARTVPESNRQRFLATLTKFCDISSDSPLIEKSTDASLTDQIDALLKALEEIQAGERVLRSEYNEEWDDWYDEDTDAYCFSDPDNILDDITASVKMLHQSLDHEAYVKGAELAATLSELVVQVSGDYDDGEMEIRELVAYDLLDIDQKRMVKEAVYLTCMGTREQERAEAMLTIMDSFGDHSVSLEQILQTGSEEIDLNSLLPSWIEALAKRPAPTTDQLLIEAQNMLQDEKVALDIASRYAESHPILYQNILLTGVGKNAPEDMMQIGLQGMQKIPLNHPVRSGISLLTAKYALRAQNSRIAENCWMEAFRTSPTVVNYLRLRLLSQHWNSYSETVQNIYTSYFEARNTWDRKPMAALMFFDERFEEMIHRFMKPGNGIGWSSTFMKEGIALMLMLLDTGEQIRQGMTAMRDMAINACSFDNVSYCDGTDLQTADSTEELFQACFQRWKAHVILPEETCELWIGKISKWISLRVSAIMNANRRNYYSECAAFVAAFGEVQEARGNPGEKARIMQQYKVDYSRRRAFHEELRRYGMRQ